MQAQAAVKMSAGRRVTMRYEQRMGTEPGVHLLGAAVLQQRLDQDVQVFFRGLFSELLLRPKRRETGGVGWGLEGGKRDHQKQQRRGQKKQQRPQG